MKKLSRMISILAIAAIMLTMFAGAAFAETTYAQTTAAVNIRTGAGTGYASMGVAAKGTKLTYYNNPKYDKNNVVWYNVLYNGKKGYVCSKYVKLISTPTYVVADKGSTYVRSAAKLSASSLGTLQKDKSLVYLDSSKKDDRGVAWYKVQFNGKTGWVSSKYTSLSTSASASSSSSSGTKITAVTGSTYVRTEPSTDSDIVCSMSKGTSGTYQNVTKKDDRGVAWYKVKYNGKTGWVSSRYTKLGSTASITRSVTATGGSTYLRSEPSLDGDVVCSIAKNTSGTYLESMKTDERGVAWYKIQYKGKTGWVSSKYTTLK